ncbi:MULTISPECIES: hypothetical protein [Natrialbaceae]|uniref:hypothetical protein n=1 Tax=Natrialbaceae TaxID=1644061 RepID=UPI00207C816D|nr:hypothetical protein [Natronococcus sp. CG52]
MSSEVRRDGRDLEEELASPATGHIGIPVDAKCVGCGRVRVKRVRLEELDQKPTVEPATLEAAELTSFKHVCYPCEGATWWNPVAVLSGLLENGGESP